MPLFGLGGRARNALFGLGERTRRRTFGLAERTRGLLLGASLDAILWCWGSSTTSSPSGPVDEELNRSVTFLTNSMEGPFDLALPRWPDDEDDDELLLFLEREERRLRDFLSFEPLERLDRLLCGLPAEDEDDEEEEEDFLKRRDFCRRGEGARLS